MMDSFFEIGISNALFSLALAVIAVVVGRFTNRPHLAHLLWLLVLAKLLMPAVIPVTYYFEPGAPTNTNLALVPIIESSPAVVDAITESQIGDKTSSIFSEILLVAKGVGLNYLPIIWCAGTVRASFWSLYRVVQVHR